MGGRAIAFADWWACDEEAARRHAREVAWERRGRTIEVCVELGVNWQSALRGAQRAKPWARFLREESARARAALRRPPRPRSETRVSDRGMMGAWR